MSRSPHPSTENLAPLDSYAGQRWMPVWYGVFYGVLALATIMAVIDPQPSWTERAASIGLALLLGGWFWGMIARRPGWLQNKRPMLIYFAGVAVLLAGLVMLHPAYFLVALVFYFQAFGFLPIRWAIPIVMVLSAVLVWQEVVEIARMTKLILLLGTLLAAGLAIPLAFHIDAITEQSRKYQRLIKELEATRGELAATEHQAGVLEERQRLARELHDSVTQLLYSLTLFVEAGQQHANTGDLERVQQRLTQVGEIAQQALKEMRLLVYELRPLMLEQEGLVEALRRRLDAVERRSGVEVRLLADEEIQLPACVEEGLYRIALEALNNALKHAVATVITVRIHTDGDYVELEVIDNGQSFDPKLATGSGGMGLASMHERAEKLGGTLTIDSTPGQGTRVKARVSTRPNAALADLKPQ